MNEAPRITRSYDDPYLHLALGVRVQFAKQHVLLAQAGTHNGFGLAHRTWTWTAYRGG
jgi:hypothetical protein